LNGVLIWILFFLVWKGKVFHFEPTFANMAAFVPVFFAGLALLNLPLDFARGYLVENQFGGGKVKAAVWLRQWFLGVLRYGLLQTVGGYLFAIWIFGHGFTLVVAPLLPGIVAGIRIWQFYLIPPCLRMPGEWPEGYENALKHELKKLKEPVPEDLYLYRSADGRTLNGGRVGMGNHSRLMISDSSTQFLTPRELAILIMREERHLGWASGQRQFHECLAWGLLGILVTIQGINFLDLKGMASWFWMLAALTTWHSAGVVALSWMSRRQVFQADRETVKSEVTKKEYGQLLRKLQEKNRTAFRTGRISGWLFHPMPSLECRLRHIERL